MTVNPNNSLLYALSMPFGSPNMPMPRPVQSLPFGSPNAPMPQPLTPRPGIPFGNPQAPMPQTQPRPRHLKRQARLARQGMPPQGGPIMQAFMQKRQLRPQAGLMPFNNLAFQMMFQPKGVQNWMQRAPQNLMQRAQAQPNMTNVQQVGMRPLGAGTMTY